MKIYIESSENSRNICNVFNIPLIRSEMQKEYDVEVSISPRRLWSNDIWYMVASIPYVGKQTDITTLHPDTEVGLFVDYASNTAFAMPRRGSHKGSMMLLASVANKHINEPFKVDPSLRFRIHSLGKGE